MHATGYLETRSRHPVALIAAISINLAVVGGILTYKTVISPREPEGIPLKNFPPPPPIIVKPVEQPKTRQTLPSDPQPRPIPQPVPPDVTKSIVPTEATPWPDSPPLPPIPAGGQETTRPLPPVEISAAVDPRFASQLQPAYPAALERLEIEGKATVKVQVGIDGRVTAVELVRADDPGFFNATRDQALRRWRFKPATRDGQPIVSWVTKTVVFTIRR